MCLFFFYFFFFLLFYFCFFFLGDGRSFPRGAEQEKWGRGRMEYINGEEESNVMRIWVSFRLPTSYEPVVLVHV